MPTNRHILKQAAELYASTLVDSADKAGGIDTLMQVRAQMDQIITYNRSHVDFNDAMNDPEYTVDQRVQLVRGVFGDCNPALVGVLMAMAQRGEFGMLPRVWDSFNQQINDKLNVAVVDVVTAVALDDHLRKVIKDKAAADLGRDIVLTEQVDPDILGGIVMTANGKRIDASVVRQLEVARTTLKNTQDGGES